MYARCVLATQVCTHTHLLAVAGGLGVRAHAALHHLRQVSQVEGVVAFGGRGQHFGADGVVHLDGGSQQGLGHALDGLVEIAPVQCVCVCVCVCARGAG